MYIGVMNSCISYCGYWKATCNGVALFRPCIVCMYGFVPGVLLGLLSSF